jgi:type IV secretion system protein VirD4
MLKPVRQARIMLIFEWLWWLVRLTGLVIRTLWRGLLWVLRLAGDPDLRQKGAMGTARWANRWEMFRGGVFRHHGPVVGRGRWGRLLRFPRDGIVQVFAATGAGKGLGIVVPTLLDYPGSIVCTDPKGENFAITARYRSTLGPVVMLNPTDLQNSHCFNPLDTIRPDHEVDDAKELARLLIRIRTGTTKR